MLRIKLLFVYLVRNKHVIMISITSDKQLIVQSKPVVKINKTLQIRGFIHADIPYEIVYDFTNIPPEKHSIILQTLLMK